tara:strand:- start:1448 stop:1729 length:282 start_codon:yes stop_codon:yes gene_type:complete
MKNIEDFKDEWRNKGGEMSEGFKIEKGIPIPIKRANSKNNFANILRSMEVGDSILFDRTEINTSSFYVCARRLGIVVTVREIDEKQSRLWRIE